VYLKTFLQGGLTRKQVLALNHHLNKIEYDNFVLQAKMHGAEFDEEGEKQQTESSEKNTVENSSFIFGDPTQYEEMSPEERENLTSKMMTKHKDWSSSAMNKKGR